MTERFAFAGNEEISRSRESFEEDDSHLTEIMRQSQNNKEYRMESELNSQ